MTSVLLARTRVEPETRFRKVDRPTEFFGSIFPINPTALPTSVFVLPRLGLRVRPGALVAARDTFRDPLDRVLLAGNWDLPLSAGIGWSRCHVLFQMTSQVSWQRRETKLDPVTRQQISNGPPVELGPIWASVESYTRGDEDPGLRIPTDRLRLITGAPIRLNDIIDGKTVKRLNHTLGVSIAEFE